ncbi:unnamed protein product [Mycena citricolor]|uniref:Uncharacterized protein n=1 Tax=Mycena citricolor TaxID=2018698 RepID=A0AAD2K2K4_9AGAR|nr:unnamed protein product [Mycena citricolor]
MTCAPATSASSALASTRLLTRLEDLASFYQKQLDWVETWRVDVSMDSDDESDMGELDDDKPEAPSSDDKPEEEDSPILKSIKSAAVRRLHWRRQIRSLELKLNGVARRRHHRIPSCPRLAYPEHRLGPARPEDILHMFDDMIATRMNSCRRMRSLLTARETRSSVEDKGSTSLVAPI